MRRTHGIHHEGSDSKGLLQDQTQPCTQHHFVLLFCTLNFLVSPNASKVIVFLIMSVWSVSSTGFPKKSMLSFSCTHTLTHAHTHAHTQAHTHADMSECPSSLYSYRPCERLSANQWLGWTCIPTDHSRQMRRDKWQTVCHTSSECRSSSQQAAQKRSSCIGHVSASRESRFLCCHGILISTDLDQCDCTAIPNHLLVRLSQEWGHRLEKWYWEPACVTIKMYNHICVAISKACTESIALRQ